MYKDTDIDLCRYIYN